MKSNVYYQGIALLDYMDKNFKNCYTGQVRQTASSNVEEEVVVRTFTIYKLLLENNFIGIIDWEVTQQ